MAKGNFTLFGEEEPYTARILVNSLSMKYGHRDYNYGFAGNIAKRYAEEVIELAIDLMPEQEPKNTLAYLEKLIQNLITKGLATTNYVSASNQAINQELEEIFKTIESQL